MNPSLFCTGWLSGPKQEWHTWPASLQEGRAATRVLHASACVIHAMVSLPGARLCAAAADEQTDTAAVQAGLARALPTVCSPNPMLAALRLIRGVSLTCYEARPPRGAPSAPACPREGPCWPQHAGPAWPKRPVATPDHPPPPPQSASARTSCPACVGTMSSTPGGRRAGSIAQAAATATAANGWCKCRKPAHFTQPAD